MNIIKRLLGLDKIEANIDLAKKMMEHAHANQALAEEAVIAAQAKQKLAEEAVIAAQEQESQAKLSPKDRATRKKESWVGVLETHVNKDNIRNGFFEIDWNDLFVLKLKQEGYGEDGDKDEDIVDRWFRELCAGVVVDGDFGGPINTGMIDINSVTKNNK
jgi:hypothetical protein